MSCDRFAPKAVRIASSLRRASVVANTRFATLAHAISNTKATAPSKTSNAGRTSPTSSSRKGTINAPQPASSAGYSFSSPLAMVLNSDCAPLRRFRALVVLTRRNCDCHE